MQEEAGAGGEGGAEAVSFFDCSSQLFRAGMKLSPPVVRQQCVFRSALAATPLLFPHLWRPCRPRAGGRASAPRHMTLTRQPAAP